MAGFAICLVVGFAIYLMAGRTICLMADFANRRMILISIAVAVALSNPQTHFLGIDGPGTRCRILQMYVEPSQRVVRIRIGIKHILLQSRMLKYTARDKILADAFWVSGHLSAWSVLTLRLKTAARDLQLFLPSVPSFQHKGIQIP